MTIVTRCINKNRVFGANDNDCRPIKISSLLADSRARSGTRQVFYSATRRWAGTLSSTNIIRFQEYLYMCIYTFEPDADVYWLRITSRLRGPTTRRVEEAGARWRYSGGDTEGRKGYEDESALQRPGPYIDADILTDDGKRRKFNYKTLFLPPPTWPADLPPIASPLNPNAPPGRHASDWTENNII